MGGAGLGALLALALAAGGALAQESHEAPAGEDVVLDEDAGPAPGEEDWGDPGWEDPAGGEEPMPGEEVAGGEEPWIEEEPWIGDEGVEEVAGGEDPMAPIEWAPGGEGDEIVTVEIEADPLRPDCGGCEAEGGVIVGEDLAEADEGGVIVSEDLAEADEGLREPSEDRPAVARGTRVRSSGGGTGGGECVAEGLRGVFLCEWLAQR